MSTSLQPLFRPLAVLAALALSWPASAQEGGAPRPEQDSSAAVPAPVDGQDAPVTTGGQGAPAQDAGPGGIVPLSELQAPMSVIPDIAAHRVEPLSYVRRMSEIVPCELVVDPDADPVLMIGERKVSRAEFRRRAIMYGAANEIDKVITRLLTQQEIARQKAAGSVADYQLTEAELQAKFEEQKEFVRMQARGGQAAPPAGEPDPADEAVKAFEDSINSSIGMAAYFEVISADALFEKVFLPFPSGPVEGVAHDFANGPPPMDEPKPDWLPQATWDALGLDEQGRNLRSFVKQWAINGEEVPGMFKASILAKVRDGLIANTGVAFFFDENMADDAILRVGTEVVKTDDLWPLIAGRLTDADMQLVVRELLTLEAMKRGLTAAERWLSDDRFKEVWGKHEAEYVGTLFPLKQIILFRGYTSLDRYREHYRYRQAYNLWRKEGLTDDEVLAHFQEGGRLFFERGNAVVDIAWAPLGEQPFTNANFEEAAKRLQAALDAGAAADGGLAGAGFTQVMEALPAPATRMPGDPRVLQRSQLRMRLAEDELGIFLTGYSLADDLFYHADKGQVYGPWTTKCRQHAWGAEANAGAWAVRVTDFSRKSPLPNFDGRNRDLAFEDYLDLNYFWWAQEGLKAILPSVHLPDAK